MDPDQLSKLPYLTNRPTGGRGVQLTSYWDHENQDWIFYMEVRPGELGRIAGGQPVRASYYAKQPAEPLRDLELRLSTLVVRRLSFSGLMPPLHSIEGDIHLFCAILEKFELISARAKLDHHARDLAASELEFLIRVIRSLYDVLQRLIKALAVLFVVQGTDMKLMQQMKDSFAAIILKNEVPQTLEQLVDRYKMPPRLASFYVAEAPFFVHMREVRNAIEHKGKDIRTVIALPQGLAVDVDDPAWKDLPIWSSGLAQNRLGSMRAVFAYLVHHVLGALSRFVDVFDSPEFVLPEPVGDFRVFLRDPYGRHLIDLVDVMNDPWDRTAA